MSVRVRVTSTAGLADTSTRVLLILTRCPVQTTAQSLRPNRCWEAVDTDEFPAFAGVLGHRRALARSTALPTIADCFVLHLDDTLQAATLFEPLRLDALPLHEVARMRKTSRKFTIRPWRQDPLTGVMQPDWAYATLDRIEATPLRGSISAGPMQRLGQVEIEIGPSSAMVAAALGRIDALDHALAQCAPDFAPVFGRKIYRLLENKAGLIAEPAPYP